MYEGMRIRYLFIDLSYSAYRKLQIGLVIGWLIGSGLFYLLANSSDQWILANAWWICLAIGILEAGESVVAIGKAKKNHRKGPEETTPPT